MWVWRRSERRQGLNDAPRPGRRRPSERSRLLLAKRCPRTVHPCPRVLNAVERTYRPETSG